MKKITAWVLVVSLFVFVVSWGIMGLKIYSGDYDFTVEAYIGLVSIAAALLCAVIMRFSRSRCPHCGRIRMDTGEYCSYCGKKV